MHHCKVFSWKLRRKLTRQLFVKLYSNNAFSPAKQLACKRPEARPNLEYYVFGGNIGALCNVSQRVAVAKPVLTKLFFRSRHELSPVIVSPISRKVKTVRMPRRKAARIVHFA